MIIPVILAGGSGTRLWPLSRKRHPKQLLTLTQDRTLLQQTILRVMGAADVADPMVICNESYRHIIAEQLKEIDIHPHSLVLEPVGRNTAPAVAVSAVMAVAVDANALILVLPSDHLIPDIDEFHRALEAAVCFTEQGSLVTFGVVPQTPETGYGYIRKGRGVACHGKKAHDAFEIHEFVEKPDLPTARKYLASGEYCWNSGMFMFRAADILREMDLFSPEIKEACRTAVENGIVDNDAFLLDTAAFSHCPSDSVDYAVMENTRRGVMIPLDAGWNDVGSWDALFELGEKDAGGNVLKGDIISRDNRDCLVFSESRLVAVLGMKDVIVVESPDAVLVVERGRSQDVKSIVDELQERGRAESHRHSKTFYHWGNIRVLSSDDKMVLRRVTVDEMSVARACTSANCILHWIVAGGKGIVRKPDESFNISKETTIRIDPESEAVVENIRDEPLVFMEFYMPEYGDAEHFYS